MLHGWVFSYLVLTLSPLLCIVNSRESSVQSPEIATAKNPHGVHWAPQGPDPAKYLSSRQQQDMGRNQCSGGGSLDLWLVSWTSPENQGQWRNLSESPLKAKIPTRAKCQLGQQAINRLCPGWTENWNNAWQSLHILLPEPLSSYGNLEGLLKEHCNWEILCPGISCGYHPKSTGSNILELETWLLAPTGSKRSKTTIVCSTFWPLGTFTENGISKCLEEN